MTKNKVDAMVVIAEQQERIAELEEHVRVLEEELSAFESIQDAWPIINGVLVVPPDGLRPDIAGHILDLLFDALGSE